MATGDDGQVPDHLKWAELILEDLKADLCDLNGFYQRCGITGTEEAVVVDNVIQLMSERIAALKEDLVDEEMDEYATTEEKSTSDCFMQPHQLFDFADAIVTEYANLCCRRSDNRHRTIDSFQSTTIRNCTFV